MEIIVDSSGWVQQFPSHPGPKDKVYSKRNTGEFIVNHSIVGSVDAALGRFMSDQRDASGNYTSYAAASVMFINPKVGMPIQMYPIWASTWTSGGPEANCSMWAVENEGGAQPNYSEPLNSNQVENLLLIKQVWEQTKKKTASRATFREHSEVAQQYGYSPTACPSGRIQPFYDALQEDEMTPEEVQAIVDQTINQKLASSQLINSAQLPELVAQILGVHDDSYSDQSINDEIREAVFPPEAPAVAAPPAAFTQAGPTTAGTIASGTSTWLSGGPTNG